MLPPSVARRLAAGAVIPAHPLALNLQKQLDERRQRALTRYYVEAGAGGVAVGVHTTQFEIRDVGLLRPVLEVAATTLDESGADDFIRVAGACGPIAQAVKEAEQAASLGYHAVLLSAHDVTDLDHDALIDRARAVGEVLPVIGFYPQAAIGGPYLAPAYWRRFADLDAVVAIKIAPFDRYRTADVVRAVSESDRSDAVALYTGNDDNILADLVTPYRGGNHIVGGLLGQWAVWTQAAVRLADWARTIREGKTDELPDLLTASADLTDANGAIFDAANRFRGCNAGILEVLRTNGLVEHIHCLNPHDVLSPGQREEIARVTASYPQLTDTEFVEEHRDRWLA